MDLNKVMLIGRMTKNPEVRTTPNGKNVATFSVATNHSYKDASGQRQEKGEFHNIVAWGKLAEICGQYLTKGRRVYLEGRLQTRDWTGQDGVKRYSTEIIAENMILLDSSPSRGQDVTNEPVREEPFSATAPSGIDEQTIETIPF